MTMYPFVPFSLDNVVSMYLYKVIYIYTLCTIISRKISLINAITITRVHWKQTWDNLLRKIQNYTLFFFLKMFPWFFPVLIWANKGALLNILFAWRNAVGSHKQWICRFSRQFWQKYSHFEKIGDNCLSFSSKFLMIFVSVGHTNNGYSGSVAISWLHVYSHGPCAAIFQNEANFDTGCFPICFFMHRAIWYMVLTV